MSIATRHPDVRPPSLPPFGTALPDRPRYVQRTSPLLLKLVELDPREVIEGVMTPAGFVTADVVPVGPMREACPHCDGVALQLVLRHRHVKRSHLFCRSCTRVYDALNESGYSVLTV
ncbi:hypothetical protein I5R65_20875 [Herbaspirillum sp. AP02]|uniref:hypothetical protein n=1 Tax=unclassified Herbaspirillum TaxID=2624150 RepID=UPI0018CBBB34|nr:hypothetical protein [Herbaspirillum sp. AP02]MBG7621931.1 hypothetical protein [Herbaspirillum sp. AP02]